MSRPGQTEPIRQVCLLACGHEQLYKAPIPKPLDLVFCARCAEYRAVTSHASGFIVKCRGCPFSRRYGSDKLEADHAATKHKNKMGTHVIDVFFGMTLEYTLSNAALQFLPGIPETMDLDDDGIPWLF